MHNALPPSGTRFISTVLLGVAVAACSGSFFGGDASRRQAEEAKNTPPVNYRADLAAFMRTYLNDPTNIRSASVSQPELKTLGPVDRYVACLRFNAKNSSGQYAGLRDSLAVFIAGKLDRLIELKGTGPEAIQNQHFADFCAAVAYQPFPELEHLSR